MTTENDQSCGSTGSYTKDTDSTSITAQEHKNPPTSIFGTLRHIGPGLILAGGCVGSGELIATTSTGGKAGIALLWLIIFGCVIKVFVQIEFARCTIFSGKVTMAAFNILPGPRIPNCCCCCCTSSDEQRPPRNRGHWIIWLYLLSLITSTLSIKAGILSGVGQALAMCFSVTTAGARYNTFADRHTKWIIEDARWPDNRSALPTYRSMQTLWQQNRSKDEEATTVRNGENRFVQLCQQNSVAAAQLTANFATCNEIMTSSYDVPALVNILGGRQAARDAGADVNTYNTTEFVISLGTWAGGDGCDYILWSLITAALTSIILAVGRYGFIQHFSTILVLAFTLVSIVNLVMLQTDPVWRLSWSDISYGLSFHLQPPDDSDDHRQTTKKSEPYAALAMAMATFGIIGVSPSQIIQYPYWCVEKGYAKYTGAKPVRPSGCARKNSVWWKCKFRAHSIQPETITHEISTVDEQQAALLAWKQADEAWLRRAKGWIRVLYCDAFFAMILYTFTTIAFYLLGAAILHRTGLEPRGTQMIRYLAIMYEPAFGVAARVLFIIGAIAVLYSTFFIEAAASARLLQDSLVQIGVCSAAPVHGKVYTRRIRFISAAMPWPAFFVTIIRIDPRALILLGGFLASAFLPILALAALYFYFVAIDDDRIKPQPRGVRWLWNFLLCSSAVLICVSGLYACWVGFT